MLSHAWARGRRSFGAGAGRWEPFWAHPALRVESGAAVSTVVSGARRVVLGTVVQETATACALVGFPLRSCDWPNTRPDEREARKDFHRLNDLMGVFD